MSARYKVHGAWEMNKESTVRDVWDERKGTVVTETADALDTRTGNVYHAGAYRVRVLRAKTKGLPRGKTFIGETAWSDADRLHDDMVSALDRAELSER